MKNPNQPQTPVFVEGTNAQRWAVTWTPARESACLGLLAWALCQPCWTQEGRGEVTVVALGKEGTASGCAGIRKLWQRRRRTGQKRGLFQKKTAITEVLIALWSQIFIIHSPTFVLLLIPGLNHCFFFLQDICPAVTGKTSLSNKLSKELVWKLLHRVKSDLITSPI